MSVISNNQLAGAAGQGAAGQGGAYQIERSLRFNSSDSAYCSRAVSTASTRKIFTISAWVKRSGFSTGSHQAIYNADTSYTDFFGFNSTTDKIRVFISGASDGDISTSAVFKDPSAWYHILFSVDTTQATSSNRVRVYVNGTEQALSGTFPVQDYVFTKLFNSSYTQYIGKTVNSYSDFYLAEYFCIDGQALDPTSFTDTDANGVLQPKAYSGSYGTNGFHLDFSDNSTAAALGTDTSGAGNDWTINNISNVDGSVATADGAKPILNTTGPYGGTLGTGVASDPNSSSLYLCAALATSAGVNLTDQQPTGRTTSSLTINNPGGFTSTTTESQYYGGSLNLTGGNYLTVTSGLGIFNGNFTIEAWFRRTGTSGLMTLFDTWCNQTSGTGFYMWWDGGGLDLVKDSSVYYVNRSGTDLPINTWCHVALVRSSNTFTCYVNGSSLFTYTVVDNWTSNRINIGGASTNGSPWVGQIQDVRIYNTAKYTANFSVPNRTAGSGSDSFVDSPTNYGTDTGAGGEVRGNYCTLNPIDKAATLTLANGNLDAVGTSGWAGVRGTIGVSSGKWYWETTVVDGGAGNVVIGVGKNTDLLGISGGSYEWNYNGTSSSTGRTGTFSDYSNGDIVGFALDLDNGKLEAYKNGVKETAYWSGIPDNTYFPQVTCYGPYGSQTGKLTLNFGQRPFAYTAPSGYKALCTQNLPTPTIADGSTVMDVALYTGNGSTQTISGVGFNPDLVWIKRRDSSTSHRLQDSVRGVTKYLESDTAASEVNAGNAGVTVFNSNGFSLGSGASFNALNGSYVAWTWDAGSSTVSNTDGSITSSVRANPSAGFSIVTYTGVTGNQNFGHGLNVKPKLIMIKNRSSSANWFVMFDIGTTYYKYGHLDTTAAFYDATAQSVSSTTVTLGNNNAWFGANSANYIALLFASVDGYSSFGSYTGNGNTDGPFVYTGFRPRWIMIKRIDATANWRVLDTARDTDNPASLELYPSISNAEGSFTAFDIYSNGFKLRTSDTNYNTSSGTYIYAAFGDPFQTARAR